MARPSPNSAPVWPSLTTIAFRVKLKSCFGGNGPVAEVERELTERHAHAVRGLLAKSGRSPRDVAVVGFHGQTLHHAPEHKQTWQIGDGALAGKADRHRRGERFSQRRRRGRRPGSAAGAGLSRGAGGRSAQAARRAQYRWRRQRHLDRTRWQPLGLRYRSGQCSARRLDDAAYRPSRRPERCAGASGPGRCGGAGQAAVGSVLRGEAAQVPRSPAFQGIGGGGPGDPVAGRWRRDPGGVHRVGDRPRHAPLSAAGP